MLLSTLRRIINEIGIALRGFEVICCYCNRREKQDNFVSDLMRLTRGC